MLEEYLTPHQEANGEAQAKTRMSSRGDTELTGDNGLQELENDDLG